MKYILFLSILFLISCNEIRTHKVIYNNELNEGIIKVVKRTCNNEYRVIVVDDNGTFYKYALEYNATKDYHEYDTIKHNIKFQKN